MSIPDKPQQIETVEELNANLSNFIKTRFKRAGEVRILEAGCGKRWQLDLTGCDYRLTGIDIDAKGLELRKKQYNDLDVAILADLCTVELDHQQFDVVYSSYVLEHVKGAEKALENFADWLKPGGFMILKFPDRNSVFGFLTRLLPFWMHVFYKKYIYRLPDAGKPGNGPFPTVYDPVLSTEGIHEFCNRYKLIILHEYTTNFYLLRLGRFSYLVTPLLKIFAILSLNKLKSDHNNLVFIIQKPLNGQVSLT